MSKSYQAMQEEKASFNEDCFSLKRPCLKQVNVDFEGRSVRTSKYVDDDPTTRYQGLKTSDFSLENQTLVGKELPLVKVPVSSSRAEETIKTLINE